LELSRAWKPSNSSGALLDVEAKETHFSFRMENKIRKNKMEVIQCKLNFTSMFVVDCVGRSGGMALLWGDEVFVEV
jgi:hypothetical protein